MLRVVECTNADCLHNIDEVCHSDGKIKLHAVLKSEYNSRGEVVATYREELACETFEPNQELARG